MLPLIALLGALVTFAIYKHNSQEVEGFAGMNYPMTFRPEGVVKSAMGPNFYSVPGTYQAALSPRFSNIGYGAYINYNLPANKNLATPSNPLSYAKEIEQDPVLAPRFESIRQQTPPTQMGVRENFCMEPQAGYDGPPPNFKFGNQNPADLPPLPQLQDPFSTQFQPQLKQLKEDFTPPRCNRGGLPQAEYVSDQPYYSGYTTPPDFTTTNYKEEQDKLCGITYTDTVPAGTVEMRSTDGTVEQPIVYDRFIYANQRSRNLMDSDKIRGDLPILPNNTGWFQVAANPTVMLQNSALGIMSGFGETARELAALKTGLMMDTQNTFGTMGNIDNSVQKQMMADPSASITWSTFP